MADLLEQTAVSLQAPQSIAWQRGEEKWPVDDDAQCYAPLWRVWKPPRIVGSGRVVEEERNLFNKMEEPALLDDAGKSTSTLTRASCFVSRLDCQQRLKERNKR